MLYPIKFKPIFKNKVWGGKKISEIKSDKSIAENCGESWEISGVQEDVSVITNGFLEGNTLEEAIEIYMSDLVGEKVFDKFGIEFPILLKIIEAKENLSVQVHPNNAIAQERHNAWGKSELWYIIEAENNSKLVSGFNTKMNRLEFKNKVSDGTIESTLYQPNVKAGDAYYIPSGRIHSLGKGNTILEIQQTSDITYRIYDYGRTDRELHIDLAEDVIDFQETKKANIDFDKKPDKSNNIINNEFFTINFLPIMNSLTKDYFQIDSFVIYHCLKGELIINYGEENEVIKTGESILIPAELKSLTLVPKQYSEIIEVFID